MTLAAPHPKPPIPLCREISQTAHKQIVCSVTSDTLSRNKDWFYTWYIIYH